MPTPETKQMYGPSTADAVIAWKKRVFEIDTELSVLEQRRHLLGQMIASGTTLRAAAEHLKQIARKPSSTPIDERE